MSMIPAAAMSRQTSATSDANLIWLQEGFGSRLQGSLTATPANGLTQEHDALNREPSTKLSPSNSHSACSQQGQPVSEPPLTMRTELQALLAEHQLVLQAQHKPTLMLLEGLCEDVRMLQTSLAKLSEPVLAPALDPEVAKPTESKAEACLVRAKDPELTELACEVLESDLYGQLGQYHTSNFELLADGTVSSVGPGLKSMSEKRQSPKMASMLSNFEIFDAETAHLGNDWAHQVWSIHPGKAPPSSWTSGVAVALGNRHNVLRMFSLALIVSNALFIGVMERNAVRNALEGQPMQQDVYLIIECLCVVFMAIELGVRCQLESEQFAKHPSMAPKVRKASTCRSSLSWSRMLDLFILTIGVLQVILQVTLHDGFRFLNFVRLLRLIQLAHILRLRTLRVLTDMIRTSLKAFCWAMVAMFCLVYIYAIFVSQTISSAIEYNHFSFVEVYESHEDWQADVRKMFIDVPTTMSTLFGAISGGIDWLDAARPLSSVQLGWIMYGIFVLFVFSMLYCLSNILIAAMVESARDVSRMDRDVVVQNHVTAEQAQRQKLCKIFHQVDTDMSGTISRSELNTALRDPDAYAYLQSMGVSSAEVWGVFNLTEKDESGNVELLSFVRKIFILRGTAKNVDLVALIFAQKKSAKVLDDFQRNVISKVDFMVEALQQLVPRRQPPAASRAPVD